MSNNLRFFLVPILAYCLAVQLSLAQSDTPSIDEHRELAETLHQKQEFDQAISILKKLIPTYRQNEDWEQLSYCQLDVGYNYMSKGELDIAEYYYQKALATSQEKLDSLHNIPNICFHLLGVVYHSTGEYDKALSHAILALEQRQKSNADPLDLAVNLGNIAHMYQAKSDYGKAKEYFEQALDVFQGVVSDKKDNAIISTYNGLAAVSFYQKNNEKALLLYKRSLGLSISTKDDENAITTYNGLALVFQDQLEWDSAYYYLKKAEKLLVNQTSDQEATLANLGFVSLKKGDYDKALSYLASSAAIYEKTNPKHPDASKVQRYIGDCLVQKGSIKKGIQAYQRALEKLTDFSPDNIKANPDPLASSRSDRDLLRTLKAKAEALALLEGEYELAGLATYQSMDMLIAKMRQGYLSEASKVFLAATVNEIYEGGIQLALRQYEKAKDEAFVELAFSFSEKSRAALVLEGAKDKQAKQIAGVPQSLVDQERQLQLDISFYNRKYLNAKDKNEPRKTSLFKEKTFELNQELTKLKLELQEKYPTYYNYKYQQKDIDIEEISTKLLDGQSALLEYFVGKNAIYLFIVSNKKLQYLVLNDRTKLDDSLQAFWNGLGNPTTGVQRETWVFNQFTTGSQALYQQLLSPALSRLDGVKQLLIIPDGPLVFVPFEVLLVKPNSSETPNYLDLDYLVYDYALSYSYSAALLLENKEALRQKSRPDFLAFAPFTEKISEDLSQLAFSKQEVDAISRVFTGQAWLGKEATKEKLQQAGNHSILHFATHGLVDHQQPNYSFLALAKNEKQAQDTKLYAYEIQNLSLDHTQLATLSACETGIGQYAKGEGLMSLARSFMYAGIPSVVMTMWQVNDQSSAQINQLFYQQLGQGKSKTKALQYAKKQYLEQHANPISAHPYYWGGYVLLGESQGHFTKGFPWWVLGLLGGLALAIFFIFRKLQP